MCLRKMLESLDTESSLVNVGVIKSQAWEVNLLGNKILRYIFIL